MVICEYRGAVAFAADKPSRRGLNSLSLSSLPLTSAAGGCGSETKAVGCESPLSGRFPYSVANQLWRGEGPRRYQAFAGRAINER